MKLLKCLFSWRVSYPSWEEFNRRVSQALARNEPVVIVTHDMGLCRGNRPGCGNHLLAKSLEQMSVCYPSVPILPQLGVALAAKEFNVPMVKIIGPPDANTPMDRSTGNYNSHSVILEQKCWLMERGKFPALALTLTHPLHMGRVKWAMEREGFEVLPIPPLSMSTRDYCDKESLYFSVRAAGTVPGAVLVLYARETLARLLFLKNGWM